MPEYGAHEYAQQGAHLSHQRIDPPGKERADPPEGHPQRSQCRSAGVE